MRILNILTLVFLLLYGSSTSTLARSFNANDATLHRIIRLALDEKWNEAESLTLKYHDINYAKSMLTAIRVYQSPKAFEASDIIRFLKNNDWVPISMFATRIESLINIDYPTEFIVEWFTFIEPKTSQGKFYFLNANIERKTLTLADPDNRNMLRYYWRITEFDIATEERILKKYRNYLTIEDCLQKIEFLTWRGKYGYAEKLLSILPNQYTAISHLRLQAAKNPDALFRLINGKSAKERSDEYIQYLYVTKLLDNDHEEEALRRLKKIDKTNFADVWWKLKNRAIRNELREKNYFSAYELASKHGLEAGQDFAEAEWLSGWIALRFLREYEKALIHFHALYDNTVLANSKSKAAYWLGRSYEALGNGAKASEWYASASEYAGTFYGHIALGRIHGEKRINYFEDSLKLGYAKENNSGKAWKQAAFAFYLYKNGANKFAYQIVKSMPELDLESNEVQNIAKAFLDNGLYGLAVDFGKTMANHSGILVRAGYPNPIQIHNNVLPKGLYLGIIRQESNFNQSAESIKGARGLMQLMPATAAEVAKGLGLKSNAYAVDPASNVLKGVTYVNQLYEQYNNIILTLAAYNAGPGSVNKWLNKYGDPRKFSSEYQTIDWIESIPFHQTRTYVKKVMENFIVYDSILAQNHSANSIIAYLENK